MSGPDDGFVTIALEYDAGRLAPAGFFCLWNDQLTFVRSGRVRLVTSVTGVVPTGVRPTGPQDPRTCTRIRYADIIEVTSHEKGWVVVRTRSGRDYLFGGGQLNAAFDYPQVSAEIGTALTAAGYSIRATQESLTVGAKKFANEWDRTQIADKQRAASAGVTRPPVQLQKTQPADHDQDRAGAAPAANTPGRIRTALRAIAAGTAGALLGAAAYAMFTILTETSAFVASAALGLIVAIPLGTATAALGSPLTRLISVALTSLSLLLSEYVVVGHFVGVSLPLRDMVSAIHADLSADKWTLLFWGISLVFAWQAPNYSWSPIEANSPRREGDGEGHRLRHWAFGRGFWWTAAAAGAIGLAVLISLERVGLDSAPVVALDKTGPVARDQTGHVAIATAVPLLQARTGDCFNLPSDSSF
ncbi:MAG: hypothetical protein QOD31_3998, partial [Pseudonocardiales bacterium]|nr:hypothetical protein [Pseudonocardiales bacterium]